jgi:hypothetical protein
MVAAQLDHQTGVKMRSSRKEETALIKAMLGQAGEGAKVSEAIFFRDDRYEGISFEKGKLRFETNEAFQKWTRLVFDLESSIPENKLLQTVFDMAGLDYEDPLHWKTILLVFCRHHFSPKKLKPRKSWVEIANIYSDYKSIKDKYPKFTEKQICEHMRRHMAKDYQKYNKDALRKIVRQARTQERNVEIRYPNAPNVAVAVARSIFEGGGVQWSKEREADTIEILRYIYKDKLAAYIRSRSDATE